MEDKILSRPIEILLIEDNYADIRLVQEGFKEDNMIPFNLNIARDGVEAMEYLHKEGKYSEAVRPDIILLDLNMPRKDGKEVMEEIKQDHDLKYIPVIVLTSSDNDKNVFNLYDLGASSFIAKPVDSDKFIHMIKSLKQWFSIIQLPQRGMVDVDKL